MSITELAIKRPILIIVLFLVLGLAGIFSYTQLRYELLPDIATPFVTLTTVWPGAAPAEVETALTKPLEDAVAGASRVKRLTAQSLDGVAIVSVEFRAGTDADLALQDCQRRVNEVLATLPVGAKTPLLAKYSLADLPILRLAATSRQPALALGDLLRNRLRPRLAQLPGVGQVTLVGEAVRAVDINLRARRLAELRVPVAQVVAALQAANLNVPAGALDDRDARFGVRVLGKSADLPGLRRLVVQTTPQGRQVRLGEVADLAEGQQDATNVNRSNGRPAVGLLVSKQAGANNVEVSAAVRAELQAIEAEYATTGLHFEVAQDGAEFTLAAADAVLEDLGLAIGLVALVMFVFLHSLRSSLIVLVAIPASLLSTFGVMKLAGFSLNLLTLLALSLVVGILVDDSIVVLESIYHELERGVEKRAAALQGRLSIGFAALAVTLVDVVVFVPLSLAPGIVGDLLRSFSLVVVASTLFSLLVSFTLTPLIAARFGKLEDVHGPGVAAAFGRWFERQYGRLVGRYEAVLRASLAHRGLTFGAALALFGAALALPLTGLVGSAFTPPIDKGEATLLIQLPEGTKLADTDRAARRLEAALRRWPTVRRIFTNVGANPDGLVGLSSPNTAELNLAFVPREQRRASLTELTAAVNRLAATLPGVAARVSPVGIFGTGDAAPVQLLVSGPDREAVEQAAGRIAAALRAIPGTADVRVSGQARRPGLAVQLDREKLARFGLSTQDVGLTLRTALTGYDDLKVPRGDQQVPLRVRLAAADRTRTDQLARLPVLNAQGQLLDVQQLGRLVPEEARAVLERQDRASSVTVFAQPVGRPVGDVGDDLRAAVARLHLPAGIHLTYAGDLELQGDAFGPLAVVFGAAVLLMYLIMVALYNSWLYPLVVLFSIPVALVGALFALAFTGNSLNVFTILGLIMMLGLVAKNAILLVDRANHNRAAGLALGAAVREAGTTRLRPILMTTLAMVCGMLPIALSHAPGAELKTGLGWTLIGGLGSSMVLTLVVVPAVYVTFATWQQWLSERLACWHLRRADLVPGAVVLLLAGLASPAARAQSAHALLAAPQSSLASPLPAQPQPVPPPISPTAAPAEVRLSLADALTRLRTESPELAVARLDVQQAATGQRLADRARWPTLNGFGQYQYNFKPPVFFLPTISADPSTGNLLFDNQHFQAVDAAARHSYSAGLNLALPLYQRELDLNRRLARTDHALRGQALRTATTQQLAEVQRLYLRALLAQSQQAIVYQTLANARQHLREARALHRAQLALDSDTLRAFVAVANARAPLARLARSAAALEADLATRLALPTGTALVLTDSLGAPGTTPLALAEASPLAPSAASTSAEKAAEATAVAQALAQRPEVQQLALAADLSRQQVAVARARALPTLALFGQYSTTSQAADFSFRDQRWPQTAYLGVQLSVPLFNPTTAPRTEQAHLAALQAEQQQRALATRVAAEARTTLAALQSARDQLAVQALTVRAAARAYGLVHQRWQLGLAKWTDLADAEEQLNQARANRLQALYDYRTADLDYQQALGTGA
jgi:hydrophobe/amphiphile efflux-1 (HAE1) family protein